MKKALQAIKNRTGMSTERAHREDAEKEEESCEYKLVALEQIATASLRGAIATKRIATDIHLIRRGFDMFEDNVLHLRCTVDAWY
jgi:phosphate uptake regulator